MNFVSSNRRIFAEIHGIFNVMRQLVQDNRVLYDSIDDAYEEILFQDLSLVPEQYDEDILNIINTTVAIFKNINYGNISKAINASTASFLHFHVNTYDEFVNALGYIKISKRDQIRVSNLVSKFKPLFKCVDSMLADPLVYIKKAANLGDSQYADIF